MLRIVGPQHEVKELGVLDAAVPEGEGGLLGVALSPDFGQDRMAYFYLTTATDNRIVRASLADGGLSEPEVLLDGIPNGFIHDGGRLEFGPDGYLYASTGEAGEPELAQDRDSLGGKILRITTDGDPAPGNPFDSPVWSWGHRNVQGLAFDDTGQLWASEFGQDESDELNLIEAGANYGWPQVEGPAASPTSSTRSRPGTSPTPRRPDWPTPTARSGWPRCAANACGRSTVQRDRAVDQTAFFVGDYGRMRTVALAPDGTLWLTTSNRDGRGEPADDDDRILQVTTR